MAFNNQPKSVRGTRKVVPQTIAIFSETKASVPEKKVSASDSRAVVAPFVSSRVVLNDLNDFISPTMECIKPIKNDRNASKESKGNHVELMDVNYGNSTSNLAGHEQEKEVKIEKDERNEIVEINLSDCLACSGCITSAESVLISMQSNKAFYRILNYKNVLYNHQSLNDTTAYDTVATNDMNMDRENDIDINMDTDTTEVPKNQEEIASSENPFKIIVVSISSQSRASLANKFGFSSMQEIWIVLSNLFTSLGVDYVFDIDFARDISLLASGCEFMARFQASQDIPILASSCPGWVCYAEKTHPVILPFLDTAKSPQQVMGSIVKDFMAKKLMINPNEICHVSIMPCYDKKLEASRQDFYNDLYSSQDVDLVLSTLEVEQILLDKNISIHQIPKTVLLKQPIFPFVKVSSDDGCLALSNGSSSGGYLEWVLRYAVKCLYNIILTSYDIQQGQNGISIIPGRNADFTTITYTPEGYSEPTLKFAYVYGFKNIQNLVRKLKVKRSGATPFHFVEVMACPQGCINGGAQSRDDPSQLPTKEWIQAVQHIYTKADRERIDAGDNAGVCNLLSEWLGVDYVSQMEGRQSRDVQRLFHTRFHAVENNFSNSNSGLLVKW